jgi:hypothetical protein
MKLTKYILRLFAAFFMSTQYSGQNLIDNYLSSPITYTVIATSSNSISQPRDLDFKPHTNELWVSLRGSNAGGSHVIVYNAGMSGQTSEYRKDTHSDHFNQFNSAMAFSEIGEFATTADAKPGQGTFMGPSLWSGDTAIFAKVFQSNWATNYPLGSHLDMLHQSPYAMGIAHDSLKVYWVFDGHNGNICRYDYVSDHSPGYDNHSAGKIWRYSGVTVSRVAGIPSHMVLDRKNRWLYFVDGGTKTLKRLKTTSGSIVGNLNAPNELLSGYYNMGNTALVETIETFTAQPCGIDYFNDRLVVGMYNSGDLYIYNTSGSSPVNLGAVQTGQAGIMGIKIGPDGKIWLVNSTQNTVVRMDVGGLQNDAGITDIISPSNTDFVAKYYSPQVNICSTAINPVVTLVNSGTAVLSSVTINASIDDGSVIAVSWTGTLSPGAVTTVTLATINVSAGRHKLTVFTSDPNGTTDLNPANDRKIGSFRSIHSVSQPFLEDFSSTSFPPSGWDIVGFNKHSFISRAPTVGSYGTNSGALKMGNFTYEVEINSGQVDYAIMPEIDLTNAVSQTSLEFNVAYARYSPSTNDRLVILASSDCGSSWTSIYDLAGPTLTTAPEITSSYVPQDWEWRPEIVSLDTFAGKSVLTMFKFISASGNNIYLDDISVKSHNVTGLARIDRGSINVFPNPANDVLQVRINNPNAQLKYSLAIYDPLGKLIVERYESENFNVDCSTWPRGIYLLQLRIEDTIQYTKLVVN